MGLYKINKLVMVKLHDSHMPYFGYMEMTGPKGGKYIVDEFNSQYICRGATGNTSAGLSEAVIIKSFANQEGLIHYINESVSDSSIKEIAKREKKILLQRGKGKDKALEMGKSLSEEVKQKIYQHTLAYYNWAIR